MTKSNEFHMKNESQESVDYLVYNGKDGPKWVGLTGGNLHKGDCDEIDVPTNGGQGYYCRFLDSEGTEVAGVIVHAGQSVVVYKDAGSFYAKVQEGNVCPP